MMSNRRWFLLLMGASAGVVGARLWLPETGLVEMPRRFAVELHGQCSFCAKYAREVAALLGTCGRTARVCDECLGLCMDILDLGDAPEVDPPVVAEEEVEELRTLAAQLEEAFAELERTNPELFAQELDADHSALPSMPALPPSNCSFCDAHHSDVAKLIAGPSVYICNECAVGAATIASSAIASIG